jgi:hypothetical protein
MAMPYINAALVTALTGTVVPADVLEAIVGQACNEVDIHLNSRGITGTVCGATTAAASAYAKALLLERGLHRGEFEATVGEFSSTVNVTAAVQALRKTAQEQLDAYCAARETATEPRRRIVKVTGW